MKVAPPKLWDELLNQEQVRYEEIISKQFPELTVKEVEEKAKKYFESL